MPPTLSDEAIDALADLLLEVAEQKNSAATDDDGKAAQEAPPSNALDGCSGSLLGEEPPAQ